MKFRKKSNFKYLKHIFVKKQTVGFSIYYPVILTVYNINAKNRLIFYAPVNFNYAVICFNKHKSCTMRIVNYFQNKTFLKST